MNSLRSCFSRGIVESFSLSLILHFLRVFLLSSSPNLKGVAMPNTGKPSAGCFACRRMKIRCDEGRPSCQRCIRARRTCPGYREPTEGRFKSMNTSAKRSTLPGSARSSRSPRRTRLDSDEDTVPGRALIARSPPTDWEDAALQCFFADYVIAHGKCYSSLRTRAKKAGYRTAATALRDLALNMICIAHGVS